jgi:hypothetical protein
MYPDIDWSKEPDSAFRTFDAPGNDLLGDVGASLRQSVVRDGTSLYAYVRNRPLVRTDPSGLISAPMTPIPRRGIAAR